MKRWRQHGPALLLAISLLAGWEAAVVLFDLPQFILPRPTSIVAALWELKQTLAGHFWVTLWESLLGLVLSVIFGAAIAVWIHFSNVAQKAVYPLVIASQTIPIIALSPVLVMWFGYAIWSKVTVVILITFFPITVNVIDGLRSADQDLLNLMRTMGARKRQIFWKVQVPSAMPLFFTGLKIAASVSVVGATIGEWLGADAGLGFFSRRASNLMKADALFAAVFLLSVMGILLFYAAKWLESTCLYWQRKNN